MIPCPVCGSPLSVSRDYDCDLWVSCNNATCNWVYTPSDEAIINAALIEWNEEKEVK